MSPVVTEVHDNEKEDCNDHGRCASKDVLEAFIDLEDGVTMHPLRKRVEQGNHEQRGADAVNQRNTKR
jgi:hypothetical protein